jgi:hypothetical protein
MEDQTSKPPDLPPGVSLPGQSEPAAPQQDQSLMRTSPDESQGPKLPLPALPAAPVVPAAPAAPAQPLPYKAEPPPALPAPK